MLAALPLGWSAWLGSGPRKGGQGRGAGCWSDGWTVLCCGFELLGSKHDVALPCPSAATLKVLAEPILPWGGSWAWAGARGSSGALAPRRADLWWCRVRDVSQGTPWAGQGQAEPEVSAGVRCWHPGMVILSPACLHVFCSWCFPGCSARTEVVLLWWGSGSSSQPQSKCCINKLGVFAKVHLGF